MNAIEFTTVFNGTAILRIPQEVAGRLPKTGRARVIVLIAEDDEDTEWRSAAYEQFLREDPTGDSIYETGDAQKLDPAFREEIQRRVREIDSGKAKGVDGLQALEEI